MLQLLESNIKSGLTIFTADGEKKYALTKVEVAKNSIQIKSTHTFSSSAELKKEAKGNIILCYSSPSVLSFQSNEDDPEKAIQSIIPGAKLEDFYIQKSIGNQSIYEVLNLNELKEVVEALQQIAIQVTDVVLEKNSLCNLFSSLDQEIVGLHHQIEQNGIFSPIEENQRSSNHIEEQSLSPENTLAFGAILSVMEESFTSWNLPESVINNQSQSKGKKQLKLTTIVCVSLLLIASLANLFFFQSYNKQLTEIDQKLYGSNASQERLTSLKEKVDLQNELLRSLNTIDASSGAYFLDQLGGNIPKQINLNYLGLEPPVKIKAKKKIEFESNEVTIEGHTISTLALNNWIEEINQMENVNEVSLLSYEDNKENKGKFVLQIQLKDA